MLEGNATLDLHHVLAIEGIQSGPHRIAVARHVPSQPQLQRVLPWLAAEKHGTYNAYQQAQKPDATILRTAGYLTSCISREKDALFVGVYKITGQRAMSFEEYWKIPR
jgi:hypothetical protein